MSTFKRFFIRKLFWKNVTLYKNSLTSGNPLSNMTSSPLSSLSSTPPSTVNWLSVQVNLCHKLLFLHQLTHNIMIDCSLNYKFNTWLKIPISNLGRTCCVEKLFLTFRTIFVHNMFFPCSAKRRASDKDLPVILPP